MKAIITIAALTAALVTGSARAQSSEQAPAPWVTHYGANEGFYHVVADKRFVGYFVSKKDACSVHVLVGPADERDTRTDPVRLTIDVKPLQAVIVQADRHQSLDIACTAGADGLALHTVHGAEAGLAQTD